MREKENRLRREAGARMREPGKPLKLRDRSLVPTVQESSGGLRKPEPEVHGISLHDNTMMAGEST
jgi:hypothetical protein